MNLKHLKSVSYGGGQTHISDAWKPVRLTQKNVRDRFDYVIDAGTMTGYQSCRSYYTAGTYGWNADVFIVGGGVNACVVAGNRAFGNIKAPRDLIKEYEDKAYEVNYNSKELDKLIDEFAYKVLAANGISDSRRVSDDIDYDRLAQRDEYSNHQRFGLPSRYKDQDWVKGQNRFNKYSEDSWHNVDGVKIIFGKNIEESIVTYKDKTFNYIELEDYLHECYEDWLDSRYNNDLPTCSYELWAEYNAKNVLNVAYQNGQV